MCLTAKDFGLQEKTSTYPTSGERPLIKKTGYGVPQKETDAQKERERGREDAVIYEKGG